MTTRTLVVTAIGLFSLCGIATTASAQPRWGRERPPQNGACFFEDRDFGGRYFCVRPGDDLRSLPSGMNDRISSIRLLGASEVTVFKDKDMHGRTAHFTRDVIDLRSDGWNDTISSIAIQNYGNGRGRGRNRDYRDDRANAWNPNDRLWAQDGIVPREGACFYSDTSFRGESFCLGRGATSAALPRGFNDRIASVRLFGGSSVRLYDDRDFRGQSKEIRRDSTDLKGRWRETVSSIRVF